MRGSVHPAAFSRPLARERGLGQLPAERDGLIARSFPAGDDRELLRRMIDESAEGDAMGMSARRKGDTVVLAYPSVVLAAEKPRS